MVELDSAAPQQPDGPTASSCSSYAACKPAVGTLWGDCPICGWMLGTRYWPHIRVPAQGGGPAQLCHFGCIRGILDSEAPDAVFVVESAFAQDLRCLIACSPEIVTRRKPSVRLCNVEQRMAQHAFEDQRSEWPPPALSTPFTPVFSLEGIAEIHISTCPLLTAVPSEVGRARGLLLLVLISNGLVSLPPELGQLLNLRLLFVNGNFLRTVPDSIGALPELQEVCFDANQLESLPPFSSAHLKLFTVPGNRLKALPYISASVLDSLEIHGNSLTALNLRAPAPKAVAGTAEGPSWNWARPLEPPLEASPWEKMTSIKLFGNQLVELPEEIGSMHLLCVLAVACNRLRALPSSLVNLHCMEWLSAYGNALENLPAGLLESSRRLDCVLLEGNPLSPSCIRGLVAEASRSRVKTVGLDCDQVRRCAATSDGASTPWEVLPPCFSVGTHVSVGGPGQYTMKLIRASLLKRSEGTQAAGEPEGPLPPEAAPADLLVVAFSASHGEPEWLGLLRRVRERGFVRPLPAPLGPLTEVLEALGDKKPESRIAFLWTGTHGINAKDGIKEDVGDCLDVGEFDVLSVIDPRMRWYSEDGPALDKALQEISKPYRRKLFIGSSMGGVGALMHGAPLADAIVAFSPQACFSESSLRPPAADVPALQSFSEELFGAIRGACSRGARVEVHCAADEHLVHASYLPLEHITLTVHPLLPRKPFARILDRGGVLMPIVGDVFHSLLLPSGRAELEHRTFIGCWCPDGHLARYRSNAQEVLKLLSGPNALFMPHPGDWFCSRCRSRNMGCHFFCYACGVGVAGAQVSDSGAVCPPAGTRYPQRGDWGCGNCGQALCSYQSSCTKCGVGKWANENTVIVP